MVNGYPGVIADMLSGPGQLIEEGGLSGIWVARQGHFQLHGSLLEMR